MERLYLLLASTTTAVRKTSTTTHPGGHPSSHQLGAAVAAMLYCLEIQQDESPDMPVVLLIIRET